MRKIVLSLGVLGAGLVPLLYAAPAQAQATRTWVSGVGDDANPCSRTAPCKTFAGAISKTAANGEINCLDPGGFGAVTITKSITIDCEDTQGSILASLVAGVIVNAANINVRLRGISINGAGNGTIGVNFINGASLTLEKMIIQNFNGTTAVGVKFSPSSANAVLMVNESVILSNGVAPVTGAGVLIQPAVGGTNALTTIANSRIVRSGGTGVALNSASASAQVTIRDSVVAHNVNGGISTTGVNTMTVMLDRVTVANNSGTGVLGSASATIRINESVITNNATGVGGGGTLRSYKNNAINGNGADGTPITQENLN